MMPKKIVVILDTNAGRNNYYCRGSIYDRLFGRASRGDLDVCVPKIVAMEHNRHYREDLKGAKTNAAKSCERYGKLTQRKVAAPVNDDQLAADIENYDFGKAFTARGGRVLDFPSIGHDSVAQRALERRRPFDENGRGYPDALIWETVMEQARDPNTTVILVSANTRDFAKPEPATAKGGSATSAQGVSPELHPDLAEDLRNAGIESERVVLVRSLPDAESLLTQVIAPATIAVGGVVGMPKVAVTTSEEARLTARVDAERHGYEGGRLPTPARERFAEYVAGLPVTAEELGLDDRLYLDPTLAAFVFIDPVSLDSVEPISSDEVIIHLTLRGGFSFEFTPASPSPQPDWRGFSYWPDGYAEYLRATRGRETAHQHLTIHVYVVIRRETGSVSDLGITSVSPTIRSGPAFIVREGA